MTSLKKLITLKYKYTALFLKKFLKVRLKWWNLMFFVCFFISIFIKKYVDEEEFTYLFNSHMYDTCYLRTESSDG